MRNMSHLKLTMPRGELGSKRVTIIAMGPRLQVPWKHSRFFPRIGYPPLLYTDFLSMLRLHGHWWIIAKSSDSESFEWKRRMAMSPLIAILPTKNWLSLTVRNWTRTPKDFVIYIYIISIYSTTLLVVLAVLGSCDLWLAFPHFLPEIRMSCWGLSDPLVRSFSHLRIGLKDQSKCWIIWHLIMAWNHVKAPWKSLEITFHKSMSSWVHDIIFSSQNPSGRLSKQHWNQAPCLSIFPFFAVVMPMPDKITTTISRNDSEGELRARTAPWWQVPIPGSSKLCSKSRSKKQPPEDLKTDELWWFMMICEWIHPPMIHKSWPWNLKHLWAAS